MGMPQIHAGADAVVVLAFPAMPSSERWMPPMQALSDMGYTKPSPIQMAAVPLGLHESRDVIGIAAKGSGKTAAYLLPMLMYVKRQLGSAPKLSAKVPTPTLTPVPAMHLSDDTLCGISFYMILRRRAPGGPR